MTKQEFLEKARGKHGYKYQYPNLNDKILSTDDIEVVYEGKTYTQKVVKHIMGRCPEKNTLRKSTSEFISEAKSIWGDRYDYSLVDYKGALKKVKIIFEGIIFEQKAISHLQGQAPEKNLNQENFIRKSKIKHGDKYDYRYTKFNSGDSPVMIGYNGVFYLQKPYQHLVGNCPENLRLSTRKTTSSFIRESMLVHDFKYNYDKTDYIKNQTKVIITCPIHGDFSQRPLSHLQGSGCPNCNESIGEKKIAKFLNENKILYDRQYKFPDCRNIFELPFDFYIPSMRTIIEFDGKQHYEPMEFFGGVESYERLKENDKIKNNYCEENYINLIRIRYDQIEDIQNILWENLKVFIKMVSKNKRIN